MITAPPPIIPTAAWRRPIGQPLPNPGRPRPGQEWQIDDGYWQGVPLGGLGAGSIGRTYRGDFARWHLDPGRHWYQPIAACQFALFVQRGEHRQALVLCAGQLGPALAAWNWRYPPGAGYYAALFPRAWFVYDPAVLGVEAIVEQLSPVLPHNYRESSYPVGVFEYWLRNPHPEPVTVGILFSWANLVGWDYRARRNAGNQNVPWSLSTPAGRIVGLVLGRDSPAVTEPWDGEFCLATQEAPGLRATFYSRFPAEGDGRAVWEDFAADGALDDVVDLRPAAPTEPIAGALAATVTLAPGESRTVPFVLAWDRPIMAFGHGRRWYKRYTRFVGRDGHQARQLARQALAQYPAWRQAIQDWQRPVLEAPDRPDWFKGMLFNELYVLVDGGTAWENGLVGRPDSGQERFATLECFDYPFYETLDVRFYGSFPLLLFWPDLEKSVMRQFAAAVGLADLEPVTIQATRARTVRKQAGAVPHDLGMPDEDPWLRPNAYHFQDVNRWKDLNAKFILLVARDFLWTHDHDFLEACWPAVRQAHAYLQAMDRDGDGIPENEGFPDQTYDTWPMRGVSAYCGGLWIAALAALEHLATLRGEVARAREYAVQRARAQALYEDRLWTGRYYRFDTSGGPGAETIMADQLAGQWYALLLGLPPVVPHDRARQALQTVFAFNVQRFNQGAWGAVNGMRPDGTVETGADQAGEVWSGVVFAVAAAMAQHGLVAEAWQTAWGAYNVIYQQKGYWFRTPEAWDAAGNFRASLYLRPLSVWALELALAGARPPRP